MTRGEEEREAGGGDNALLAAGAICTLAAAFSSFLFCNLPSSRTLSLGGLLIRSALDVLGAAVAGGLGLTSIVFLQGSVSSRRAKRFASCLLSICLFFPSFVLLYRQQSLWAVATIALVAAGIAAEACHLLHDDFLLRDAGNQPEHANFLSSLYEPINEYRHYRTLLIALGIQASAIFAVTGPFIATCIATALSACLLAWRLCLSRIESTEESVRKSEPQRRIVALVSVASMLMLFSLTPYLGYRNFSQNWMEIVDWRPTKAARVVAKHNADREDSSSYVGVILWPPRKKEEQHLRPLVHQLQAAHQVVIRPVEIKFDGPYWYFQSPDKQPTRRAHVAYGRPTQKNIHSSNWTPLQMEAHQNLPISVDIRSCREIDVYLTNADTRSGVVHLGLTLTDTRSTLPLSLTLGGQLIASTGENISLDRPAISEIVRFPIPRSVKFQSFNTITVRFLSSKERNLGAPQMAVDKFVLVPD